MRSRCLSQASFSFLSLAVLRDAQVDKIFLISPHGGEVPVKGSVELL